MMKKDLFASPSTVLKQALLPNFPIPSVPFMMADSEVFLMGSCFSDAMLSRFQQRNIPASANPFGTIYHPLPLLTDLLQTAQITSSILKKRSEAPSHNAESIILKPTAPLYSFQNRYHSLQHAYRFSSENSENLCRSIHQTRLSAAQSLANAATIVITLGTAWHYHHLPTQSIVGNCHKLPSQQFEKRCSSTQEIQSHLTHFFDEISNILPDKNWIISISPVRHTRDGIQENLRSKSTLIYAVNDYLNQTKIRNIHYFPAYEIMREELNDWRFFKEDLMHPTSWSEDYIFQRFTETYYSAENQTVLSENFKRWKQQQHQ